MTVILDTEYGLVGGLVLSFLNLIWRSNTSTLTTLGAYSDTDIYVGVEGCDHVCHFKLLT